MMIFPTICRQNLTSLWLRQCNSVARQRPEDNLSCATQPVSSGFGQRRGKTKVIITNPPTTKPLNPKTDHTTNKDHANTADKYLT